MKKITICAEEKGGFTNFVKEKDQVKKDQILGAVAVYSDVTPVVSTVDGQIIKINLHTECGCVVEKNAVLYEILTGLPEILNA